MENNIVNLFFADLKKYNLTNYRTLERADLSEVSPVICKAFSSALTRYFIFCENHPEVSVSDKRMLYFLLKLDIVANYFTEYPYGNMEDLKQFQTELRKAKGGT